MRLSRRCPGAMLLMMAVSCGYPEPPDVGDDEPSLPEVEFVVDKTVTDEGFEVGGLVHNVKVGVTPIPTSPVRVIFELSGGTAALGTDFQDDSAVTGEVSIPAGELEASIPLRILFDNAEEPDEKFTLMLVSAEGAELGTQLSHEVTIGANALPQVQFVEATSTASEGGGDRSIVLQFNVAPPLPVDVNYTVTGTAALLADHGLASGTLNFAAGQMERTLALPIVDDASDEFDETVVVTLSIDANARVGGVGVHTHTIADDDNVPAIAFAATSSNTIEAGTANVNVTLSAVSGKPVTVDFALAGGGSATGGGTDFTFTAGTLTFPPGTTSLPVPVGIVADALDENDETVALVLSNATNTLLVQGSHTLTINDDDAEPTVRFDPSFPSLDPNEGDFGTGTFIYRVILSVSSGRVVTVNVNVGGDATRGGGSSDYDFGAGDIPVTFQPGDVSKDIRVIVNGDQANEQDNEVIMTLVDPDTAQLANGTGNTTRIHTILDDD